ncbi:TPA: hypothetical protein HA239_04135 [Candidatus Woesearchaeota archaeon]|nr:hypothetical protein QT06_C0001G0755 [archaeon GW2011_AR15]MBS3103464.1 hypothetical protein [Candidatus Woesearchaeota archaeon]HIH41582.1 hypothetical protein [Candidatus Woesearchaeota archaeon]
MDKKYTGHYPDLRDVQFDSFGRAALAMLNARRYLESEKFTEYMSPNYDEDNINSIAGKIVFPDGSTVDNEGFKETRDRNSLLERIIRKDAKFERFPIKEELVICTYQLDVRASKNKTNRPRPTNRLDFDDAYTITLSVMNTESKKMSLVRSVFPHETMFGFQYELLLRKDVITDENIEQFQKYTEEINRAAATREFLKYSKPSKAKK